MKSIIVKTSIIAMITCVLLVQNATVLTTIPTTNADSLSFSDQVIKMNNVSTISLLDAQFLMQDQGRIIAFTFLIKNTGNKELSLNDYWVRLRATNGKSFTTKISEQDKSLKAISANSSDTITFYSIVDKDTKLNEFVFDIVEWDFSAPNYERKLGSIQFPKGSSVSTPVNKEKLSVFGNSKLNFKIDQVIMTQDQNNAYLQINYQIRNNGLNSADLSKLNLLIQTDSLAVYPLDVSVFASNPLRSGEQKIYTLNVALPKHLIDKSLDFVTAIKEEANGVMLPIASLQIPLTKDNTITPIDKTKHTFINGQKINTFLESAFLSKVQDKTTINIHYAIRNVGLESVDYPNMAFSILTANGVTYPLTIKKTAENSTKLIPQIREVLEVEGILPADIDLNQAQIVVFTGANEKSEGYVLGSYLFRTSQQLGAIGSSYKYNNYNIKLESIQRVASTDKDTLIADLVITNKGSESSTVPMLGGYFMINGVKLNVEAKKITLNNNVTIAPGQSINLLVYSNIPYSTSITNISFILTNQTSSDANSHKHLFQFTSNTINEIASIQENETYSTKIVGQRSDVNIKRSRLINFEDSQIFYVELDLTNKEARASKIAELGGYLSNDLGEIIPVSFSQTNNQIRANGRVLISGWAKVPQSFKDSKMEFVMGQKVGTTGSENDEESSATGIIIKPVKYKLNFDSTAINTSFSNIAIGGYELSLSKIHASLHVTGMFTVSGVKLQTNYSLKRDKSYDLIAGDHKVLVEFVDQNTGKPTYSKQFGIGATQAQETILKPTEDGTLEIIFEDEHIQNKIQKYDDYVINIYTVIQDAKILLASKQLKWFQTTQ
ncbi:hypothetical protein [Paenibacillus sp. PL2-23]|uniref:hypothetical protein n=1 Tax=Paenibacillus sp. PL2-23 TaxID=2100729 RepID=UPI0030F74160